MNEHSETSWPLGGAERKAPERDHWLNRLSQRIHRWLAKGVSNLRLSLTLRIALHYAGQLLKTTLPMMGVLLMALWLTQIPFAAALLKKPESNTTSE